MKLISCIMPSKRSLTVLAKAVANFHAQTYPCKELVILRTNPQDTGLLSLNYPEVRCHAVPDGLSIGELRNIACRLSRGSVIGTYDDDDRSHPERLARSMAAIDAGASLVGSSRVIFEETPRFPKESGSWIPPRRWLFDGAALTPHYLVGGTMVYLRELWERQNFLDVQQGEDSKWQWWHWKKVRAHNPYGTGAWVDLADSDLYTATISDDNTSKKQTDDPGWSPLP